MTSRRSRFPWNKYTHASCTNNTHPDYIQSTNGAQIRTSMAKKAINFDQKTPSMSLESYECQQKTVEQIRTVAAIGMVMGTSYTHTNNLPG